MDMPLDFIANAFPSISGIVLLKRGGQKSVYSAVHRDFGNVALKLIPAECADERILREIQTGHERCFVNVPKIFFDGTIKIHDQDFVYIIEQFIDGDDLRVLRQKGYHFSFNDILIMLETILKTLVDLEKAHIVHRDIKPDNIIRDTAGNYWLIDFGIARELDLVSLTATSDCLGPHTLGYASPEQLLNQKRLIDSRSDLFSLGLVVYELFTGINPFTNNANGIMDILSRTQTLILDPLKIKEDKNGELSAFIHTLLQKSPLWRPPTARIAYDWFMQLKTR